jgi:hypothetical protein
VGIYRFEKKLRSATLTVAVLIFFVIVLALAALFWLLLTGLAALLAALGRVVHPDPVVRTFHPLGPVRIDPADLSFPYRLP